MTTSTRQFLSAGHVALGCVLGGFAGWQLAWHQGAGTLPANPKFLNGWVEERRGGSSPPEVSQVSVLGGGESLLDTLRAATAKFTQAERLAELRRMSQEDVRGRQTEDGYTRNLKYLALIQPEDVPAALEMYGEWLAEGERPVKLLNAALESWARSDAQGLEQWLLANGQSKTLKAERPAAIRLILQAMTQSGGDPFAGWDKADALRRAMGRELGEFEDFLYIVSASELDPIRAHAQAQKIENNKRRESAMNRIITTVAQTDFEAALRLARAQSGEGIIAGMVQQAVRCAIYAGTAPPAELAEILLEQPGNVDNYSFASVLEAWKKADADAAQAWIEKHPEIAKSSEVVAALSASNDLYEKPLQEHLDYVLALPPGERTGSLQGMTERLAAEDPARIPAIFQTMSEQELANCAPNALAALAGYDPATALQLAAGLPPGATRASAYQQSLEKWATYAPGSVEDWIGQQSDTDAKSAGALAMINHFSSSDPATAAQWAMKQERAVNRTNALDFIMQLWGRNEPSAAQAWLDRQSDLTPEVREKLQATIKKSGVAP